MKNLFVVLLITIGLSGCFRQEIVVSDYTVPDMGKTEAAQFITGRIKQLMGINAVDCDIDAHVISVTYNSDSIRFMNIEEAIALAGFSVNNRPANPAAKKKLPASLLAD